MAQHIRTSGSRRVEGANGQSRFIYQANVELRGLLWLLSPLLAPILRRRFQGDLRRLKGLMEKGISNLLE